MDEAFARFADVHVDALMGHALRLCGNRTDAEDIVQEVLTRIGAAWWRLASRERLDVYAHTSVARLHVDRWRKRRREILVREPVDTIAPSSDSGGRLDMQAALLLLAPRQRAVLVMRYYLDWSEAQIADALRCSPGTVKSQASDALARLRTALTDDDLGRKP